MWWLCSYSNVPQNNQRQESKSQRSKSTISAPNLSWVMMKSTFDHEDVDASFDDDCHQFPVTCPRATNTADFTHGQRYHHHHCHHNIVNIVIHNIVDFCQTRDLGYFDDSEADRGFSRKQRPLCWMLTQGGEKVRYIWFFFQFYKHISIYVLIDLVLLANIERERESETFLLFEEIESHQSIES